MDEKKEKILVADNAWEIYPGPILVLAGPGTGKTYQLAKRIQYLVNVKNVSPSEITVITFTREAAKSMKNKLRTRGKEEYIEEEKRPNRISTMHSLAYSIVQENHNFFGLPKNFEIIEEVDLIKTLIQDAALILGFNAKEAKIAFEERLSGALSYSEKSCKILDKYEEILKTNSAIDQDGLILWTCRFLTQDEKTKKRYLSKTKYLLVDEYQDINEAQFEFIKLLSQENKEGMFVVGDDDQSIYSWRGGSPIFIRNFHKNFGEGSTIIRMKTSHRCLCNILDCANSVVTAYDKSRIPKETPVYEREEKGEVFLHNCPSDTREAEIIISILSEEAKIAEETKDCSKDAFVLVLNKYYAQKIKYILQRSDINFEVGLRGEKTSVDVLFDAKKAVADLNNNLNLRWLIELMIDGGNTSLPTRRVRSLEAVEIRRKGLLKIAKLWKETSIKKGLWEVICEIANKDNLVKELMEKINNLQESYHKKSVPKLLYAFASELNLWPSKEKLFEDLQYDKIGVSGVSKNHYYRVRILTIQGAKGQEANSVFIIGLEDGIFPKEKDPEKKAEEARRCFVAMTRAKEKLHLFYCRTRSKKITFAKSSYPLQPSCFLKCLSEDKIIQKYHPRKS
jgi:DNA helicase-2/ATP-dependent DNA helicase PcrA